MDKFGYIVVDVETGGLDVFRHRLLTIGIVFLDRDLDIVEEVEIPVKDSMKYVIDVEALGVNKLNPKEIMKIGWSRSEVVNFLERKRKEYDISQFVIAGWNVSFDVGFLKRF